MQSVTELGRLARELSKASFAARWSHPFLVVGGLDEAMLFDFHTNAAPSPLRSADLQERLRTLTENEPAEPIHERLEVLPVLKSEHNPYSDRISLGRSKACDIALPDAHVSKLHAHFLREPDGGWALRDADSTNGTFRNGVRLAGGERVRIKPGDLLRFGFLDTRFVDALGLHEWLRQR